LSVTFCVIFLLTNQQINNMNGVNVGNRNSNIYNLASELFLSDTEGGKEKIRIKRGKKQKQKR